MTSIFKKSLACCLAVVLCLTCMLGALTVSAAEVKEGTFTVENATVTPGTASAEVKITIDAEAANVIIMQVETEAGAVTAVRPEDATMQAVLDAKSKKIYVSNGDNNIAPFDSVVIFVTVTLADNETEAEYDVTAKLGSAASNVEDEFVIADATGKIIVKAAEPEEPPHVHEYGELISATPAVDGGAKGEIVFKCASCDENIVEEVVYEDIVSVFTMEAFVESEIMMTYSADLSWFPEGYEVESTILSVVTNNTNTGTPKTEYVMYEDTTTKGTEIFWNDGVAAYQMTENMTATVYGKVNGVWCSGWQAELTFAGYAETLLKMSTTPAKIKTVIVDLLNFGSAVQTLNSYNVEALANNGFDAYQSLGSDTSVSPEAESDVDLVVDYNAPIFHATYELVADSRVETKIELYIEDAYASTAAYVAEYTDGAGVAHKIAYVIDEAALATLGDVEFDEVYTLESTGASMYAATFAEFAAYEAEASVMFTLYSDGVAGETLGLSTKGLAALTRDVYKANPKSVAVFDALIRYFNSAKVAFG